MNDVRSWLEKLGLGEYAQSFEANRIDAAVLPHLTEQDLSNLGLPIGPRRKILVAIRSLNERPGGASSAAAERRHITVMFCDLVGSTTLSELLDEEDLRDLIRAYQQAAGAAIERYDGHVAQYLGDGLMSYFGWPAAHEDDAERAIRASLEVVGAVKAVAAPKPLQVRIGIASGPVVVGESGADDASLPELAVGETPNLAARLQGIAGPDEVVIAASTRRLVGAAFDLEDIGKQTLKGIAAPMHTWRVTGVAQAQGRFEAAHIGRLTPFVGRESELALLNQRWQQVKNGEGQVVLVCGEPGIGKSRLAQMLREGLSGEPHAQLRYQCSPYHTNSALYPVIEQLKGAAGFDREDDLASKTDKMETLLRAAFVDISAVAPLFAALLSLDGTERYPRLNVDPQRQKHETLKALAGQIAALAAKQPVLMIFEDAHWIDPTTQQALDLIVPAIAGQHVLAVITSRPEYPVSWTGLGHLLQLAVTRFDHGQAGLMVQKLTGSKTLPKEVLEHIVVRTDGVPLFLEELTKTVLESSLLEEGELVYHLTGSLPDFAIPFSLQDSLMARLDRLASGREIAQIGACIGRQFSHDLLAAVSGRASSALDDALAQLVDAELVFHVRTSPSAAYMFKHALVQDAAYNSLLRTHRATIHQRIGETLLAHFPEVAESAPETLAHHFTEGAMFEKAVGYWRIAAERASARYANIEAIGQYKKGLATCARLPDGGEQVELELALRMGLIASLRMADRYD
ncbi:MAG: AAA family ATPase, partial [Burkholderiales bacterium]